MREVLQEIRRRLRRLRKSLVWARHSEWSIVSSVDDLEPKPTAELIRFALEAAASAMTVDLSDVAARCRSPIEASWITLWPGEHYRLLAALVRCFGTANAIEVGTYKGASALSLLAGMPDGHLITYDVVPWDSFRDTLLSEKDFGSRLEQRLGNLADTSFFAEQKETLLSADVYFIDGPKDGVFENLFLPRLLSMTRDRRRLVILDDIRIMNMVGLWRELDAVKLDLTSFGHWTGTGMIFTA